MAVWPLFPQVCPQGYNGGPVTHFSRRILPDPRTQASVRLEGARRGGRAPRVEAPGVWRHRRVPLVGREHRLILSTVACTQNVHNFSSVWRLRVDGNFGPRAP